MENCDDDDDDKSSSSGGGGSGGGGGGSGGSIKKFSFLGAEKSVWCFTNTLFLLMAAVSLIILNAGLSNTRPQDTVMRFLQVLIFIKLCCG
jgi:hypothetical protein